MTLFYPVVRDLREYLVYSNPDDGQRWRCPAPCAWWHGMDVPICPACKAPRPVEK